MKIIFHDVLQKLGNISDLLIGFHDQIPNKTIALHAWSIIEYAVGQLPVYFIIELLRSYMLELIELKEWLNLENDPIEVGELFNWRLYELEKVEFIYLILDGLFEIVLEFAAGKNIGDTWILNSI